MEPKTSKAGPIRERFIAQWKLANRDVSNGVIPTLATLDRLRAMKADLNQAISEDFENGLKSE
ncbi:MAG TPA: hypothetical protein VFK94_06675 [Patescibacteria group bacterium]|nr:hypothetical protein [Patescibacteria group bacterium]